MKTLIQFSLFLSLIFSSFFATAGQGAIVPEISLGSAVLGFGLLAGLVALIAETRRKK